MTAGHIAVAGEALIDLIAGADGRLTPHVGGAPVNTARTIARLGGRVVFLGGVSRDRFGDQIAETLRADGVGMAARLRTSEPTPLAVAEIDADGTASYRFHLRDTALGALTPERAAGLLPRDCAALHVGSLGLAVEPLAGAVESLAADAKAHGALLMLDPNPRAGLIPDPESWSARLRRLLAMADIVKVSDEDLRILMPQASLPEAPAMLRQLGARLVLRTCGALGAVASGPFGELHCPAPAVSVVDTVGAGDVFSGAWLARWQREQPDLGDAGRVRAITDFATAIAARSCESAGASPPDRQVAATWRAGA